MSTSELAHDLRIACMRLVRRIRHQTESLAPHLFSALALVESHPGQTAAELAALERVSAPSMSRTVNELLDRGLVQRAADESDRRRQPLTITSVGSSAMAEARTERDLWMREHLGGLPHEDLETLRRATTIINTMLEAT